MYASGCGYATFFQDMTKSILSVAILVLACTGRMAAGEPSAMTIGRMFEIADRHNAEIAAADASTEVARREIETTKATRLPQIGVSLSLSYLGDGTILNRDFSHPTRDPLPHFSNTLSVELYQPVFTGGAISGGIEIAERRAALADISRDGTRAEIRMKLVANYLNLAKCRNLLAVYNENIGLTRRLLKEMQARHGQGIVLKNDITRYELRLSSLGYDSLEIANSARICNSNLVSLLDLDADTEIITDINAVPTDEYRTPTDIRQWQSAAGTHAVRLRAIDAERQLAETSRRLAKAEYMPKIGIVAGDNFLGPVTFEVPALNKNYNAWFVGVNVKWNVSSLFTANKAVRKADSEIRHAVSRHEAAIDETGRAINETYTLYTQALARLDIERKNLQLANENYTIVSRRFDNQLALLTDMLDASNARLDAGVRLVNASIQAIYYYYQLHFIAGTL